MTEPSTAEEPQVPTPAAGQRWHSLAFKRGDHEGRVEVLGVLDSTSYGLIVIEHLVHAGPALGARPVVDFLRHRTYHAQDLTT